MHTQFGGQLGDAEFAVLGQQFQHRHRPIDGLHECGRTIDGTSVTAANHEQTLVESLPS
ncbi:hypothetical protein GCM10010174_74630 [Kutzneria viridogrisea]